MPSILLYPLGKQDKKPLIFSIENASILKDQLQDGLCILAAGGGYAKRTLWTSTDETAVNLRRPVMINGINPVLSRPDLLDRSLCLDIPQLKKRKTDESLVEDFNKDRPQIIAGLMDLLSNVLQKSMKKLPNHRCSKDFNISCLSNNQIDLAGGET